MGCFPAFLYTVYFMLTVVTSVCRYCRHQSSCCIHFSQCQHQVQIQEEVMTMPMENLPDFRSFGTTVRSTSFFCLGTRVQAEALYSSRSVNLVSWDSIRRLTTLTLHNCFLSSSQEFSDDVIRNNFTYVAYSRVQT